MISIKLKKMTLFEVDNFLSDITKRFDLLSDNNIANEPLRTMLAAVSYIETVDGFKYKNFLFRNFPEHSTGLVDQWAEAVKLAHTYPNKEEVLQEAIELQKKADESEIAANDCFKLFMDYSFLCSHDKKESPRKNALLAYIKLFHTELLSVVKQALEEIRKYNNVRLDWEDVYSVGFSEDGTFIINGNLVEDLKLQTYSNQYYLATEVFKRKVREPFSWDEVVNNFKMGNDTTIKSVRTAHGEILKKFKKYFECEAEPVRLVKKTLIRLK